MSKSLSKILIGSSLSEESDEVVATGVALARASGAHVELIHALPPPPAYGGLPIDSGVVESEWLRAERRSLEGRLDAQARRTGLCDLATAGEDARCHGRLRLGAAHQVLVEMAGELGADLIVIGTADLGRRWRALGSTADRVLRKAPCPVLVVRPGSAFPPAHVLAPVDLSPLSANAVRRGFDLLATSGNDPGHVEFLFVLNPLEREGSLQFTPEQIGRFAADELSRFVATTAPLTNGALQRRVRTGYPRDEILAELDERRPDLVLIGTHGRSGLERMLLGSIAADVVREAHCSVLVVPPDAVLRELARQDDERVGADWVHVSDEDPAPAPA